MGGRVKEKVEGDGGNAGVAAHVEIASDEEGGVDGVGLKSERGAKVATGVDAGSNGDEVCL